MKAKQHRPGMRLAAAKDYFTKVLVVRDEDSALAHGSGQDVAIVCLRHDIRRPRARRDRRCAGT